MNKEAESIIKGHQVDAKKAVKCDDCDRSVFPEDLKFHKKFTCPNRDRNERL